MLQKHRSNKGTYAEPLTLSDAAEVGGIYARSIGIAPYEGTSPESLPKASKNNALALITPISKDCSLRQFESNVDAFLQNDEVIRLSLFSKKPDSHGIAFTIASCFEDINAGICADVSLIPDGSKEPEASDMAEYYPKAYIIATENAYIPRLSVIAEGYSLSCSFFAKGFEHTRFTILKNGVIIGSVDTSLILDIVSKNFVAAFNPTKDDYICACNSFVRAVLPAVAAGAKLSDITVRSRYEFPLHTDSDEIRGRCLSLILGAYRSQIELCTAASKPEIEFKEIIAPVGHFASGCTSKHTNDASSIKESSPIYLLSYNIAENGAPDYDSLRAMCRTVHSLIESGSVIYSSAVTSSAKESLDSLSDVLNVELFGNTEIDLEAKIQGIILITSNEINVGITLGRAFFKEIEEEEKAIDTVEENLI
jgi:hypothetical protein